jgi:uncharacterized protein (TIGR00725 family)
MTKVGIIGAGLCDPKISALAEEVGRRVAEHKAILYCGGLGGVMEASAKGAVEAGGINGSISQRGR